MPPLLAPLYCLLALFAVQGGSVRTGLLVAVVAGALAPDVDLLLLLVHPAAAVRWHRGFTHTLGGLLLAGALAGVAVFLAGGPPVAVCVSLAIGGALVHAVFDALSTHGLAAQLLVPHRRLALALMVPLDPLATGLAALGVGVCIGFPGAARIVSLGVALLIAYLLALRGFARQRALAAARGAVKTPIEGIYPRPESPMRWTAVTRTPEGLEALIVDLGRRRATPLERLPSAEGTLSSPIAREVLRVASYPVVRQVGQVREIRDLRFAYDWPAAPFGADIEVDAKGATVRERVYI